MKSPYISNEDVLNVEKYTTFLGWLTKDQRIAWRKAWDASRAKEFAMPRGRPKGSTNKTTEKAASSLVAALNFIEPATEDSELVYSHVMFKDNYVLAFNSQLSAGHPVEETIEVNPHFFKLKKAIARSGKTLALATTTAAHLSIKGDGFKAMVPCVESGNMMFPAPDDASYEASDEIKEAFKVCGILSTEASTDFITASLLLEDQVCTSSNRAAMLQYWHGVSMPPGIVIPKVFAAAVAKVSAKLTHFGFKWSALDSNSNCFPASLTFWFENGAWLKTICYNDRWPDINKVLNVDSVPTETPPQLFETIAAIADFSDHGVVTFGDNKIMSHTSEEIGATQDIVGIQPGKQFNGKLAKQVLGHAKTIDLTTYPDRAFFFSDQKIRGVIMCCKDNR